MPTLTAIQHSVSVAELRPALGRHSRTVTLDAATIARVTRSPARTVRYQLARWRAEGGPVRVEARACGGVRYVVEAADYAARLGLRVEDLAIA